MPLVHLQSAQKTVSVQVASATTVLAAIQQSGLSFAAPCGGKGSCGKCLVRLHEANTTRLALACQLTVEEDLHVELLELLSNASLFIPPQSPSQDAHQSSLQDSLQGSLQGLFQAPPQSLSDIWALEPKEGLGLAVDLGTTTLAARLVRLSDGALLKQATAVNPQAAFGADVVSRIHAAGQGRLKQLQQLALGALLQLTQDLLDAEGAKTSELTLITLAGNTVMQHLLCGLDPQGMGAAPFSPLSLFGAEQRLPELPAPVWLAPCVSAFVGGDLVCGMAACALDQEDEWQLLLDLGTNGELVLGCRDALYSSATAAGPVFEAATIGCGMPAAPGAIRAVRLAGGSGGQQELCLEVVGGGTAQGLSGSGLLDAVACLLELGLIDESGALDAAEEGFELAAGIALTQKDIRSLQLGKAAIAAGIQVLCETAGITPKQIAKVHLAGGLGQGLQVKSAARLGLIPPELAAHTQAVGNSSLEGATGALLSPATRQRLCTLAASSESLDLAKQPAFAKTFIDLIGFEEAI